LQGQKGTMKKGITLKELGTNYFIAMKSKKENKKFK
jgi:hypothetical protein